MRAVLLAGTFMSDSAHLGTQMCYERVPWHAVLHAVSVCRSSDVFVVITVVGVTFVLQARIL